MKCPRCSDELAIVEGKDVTLDVCEKGCGGIWFDARELDKMMKAKTQDEDLLRRLSHLPTATVHANARLHCPLCAEDGAKNLMFQRFYNVKKSVEIDECRWCNGLWLDGGELLAVNAETVTPEEQRRLLDQLIKEEFDPMLDELKNQSEGGVESARKIAAALRYICPSNYIKGKQDWGAF